MTAPTSKATRHFCAICTADIPSKTPRMAPYGRNEALVNVCDSCFDEIPQARTSARPYEVPYPEARPPAKAPHPGGTAAQFRRGAARANPRYAELSNKRDKSAVVYPGLRDGYEPLCVPRRARDGHTRDNKEARAYAMKSWGGSVVYAGMTASVFVFQRPRRTATLEPIAKFQRK